MFYNFKGVYMSSTVFSNRKYNLSNSDLAIFANSLVFVMNRDLTEFENYGVTSVSISNEEFRKREPSEGFKPSEGFCLYIGCFL